jgi:peptidoglycan hydrolase CwlO-like protein
MIRIHKKAFLIFCALSVLISTCSTLLVFAQTTPPDTSSDKLGDLQGKIKELEGKVTDLKNQGNSLSAQIGVMDNQIKLTEYRMNATQQEITDITLDIDSASKRMGNLEGSLDNVSKVLINRIKATYKTGTVEPLQLILASDNISDAISRINYLRIVQAHDQRVLLDTQQAKNDYENQKNILLSKKQKVEALKTQLETYTTQLDSDKKTKQKLLEDTKGQEQNYQSLLSNARAEYEAIQNIVAGGGNEVQVRTVAQGERIASIIPGPSCNSGGAHLHFIVNKNGGTESPFGYLKDIEHENCSGSSCGSSDGDPFNPSGSWDWPISGPIRMTQGYGSTWAVRNSYIGQIYSFHNGIDIVGSSFEVKAVKPGTLYQGSYTGGNGCRLRYVKVSHPDLGLSTLYLHINY